MALGVLVGLLAVLSIEGSVVAGEGYAKDEPSVPFKEGPAPTPSSATVSISEGKQSAATPANPSPTALTPLAAPGWTSPFSILGAYPGAHGDVAGRYLGGYHGVLPHGYAGALLGGYPAGVVSQDYASRWYGPVAIPVVLPDGTLANTPEVVAARAQHLAALNRAKALWFGKYDDGSYNPLLYGDHAYYGYARGAPGYAAAAPSYGAAAAYAHAAAPAYAHAAPAYAHAAPGFAAAAPGYAYGVPLAHGSTTAPYNGPLASPTVLPSGYLADTPEIAAARAAHLTTLARSYEEAALWRSKNLSKGWK